MCALFSVESDRAEEGVDLCFLLKTIGVSQWEGKVRDILVV